jgi:agmatinase
MQVLEHWDSSVRAGAKIVTAESMHTNEEHSLNTLAAWIEGDVSPCCLVLDMQVLDSGYASGTPQIDIGGMTPQQFMAASQRLRGLQALAGAAVFNCAPALDLRGHTEHLAAHGLVQAMASLLFEPVQI